MILYRTVFRKLAGFAPWVWGGALGAAVVFSAFLSLPGESCASVKLTTTVSHQQIETTKEGEADSNSVQQRFLATMNTDSRFSTKLKINGRFSVSVIRREKDAIESTEIQPNIKLRFSTSSFTLDTGYRETLREETITSTTTTGPTTISRTSGTKELVADAGIRAGKLPDTRLRYLSSERQQEASGALQSDTKVEELRGSINYRLGIFGLSADHAIVSTENTEPFGTSSTIDGYGTAKTELVQTSGQLHATKSFGSRTQVSLRESYSMSESDSTDTTPTSPPQSSTKNSNSTTEARLNMTPIKRTQISTSYLYTVRTSETSTVPFVGATTVTVKTDTTEKVWNTAASYAMPKYFRFYGSYSTRETETGPSVSNSDVTVYGLNFDHRVGKFSIVSRYEHRINEASSSDSVRRTETENTTDLFDWAINANLSRYLSVALSESYVTTTTSNQSYTFGVATSAFTSTGGTTESTLYRLKANIGPIRNIVASPTLDHTIAKGASGAETTSTVLLIPVTYTLNIRDRIRFTFSDNYRSSTSDSGGTENKSTSNNAIFRVDIPKLMTGTTFSADASFMTSTTNDISSSTSSYTMRLGWSKNPHRVSLNWAYQTGSNRPETTSYALQYALNMRMRKISLALSSTYKYTVTQGSETPTSTGQTLFVTLSLRN